MKTVVFTRFGKFGLLALLLAAVPLLADAVKCGVCGMEINAKSKTGYSATREGKPVHFCSFVCAHSFHQKFPKVSLQATDFLTGNPVEAEKAYYIVKSKNLSQRKDLEFEMPPPILAFSAESAAKKFQADLKDGEVVTGFRAVEAKYE